MERQRTREEKDNLYNQRKMTYRSLALIIVALALYSSIDSLLLQLYGCMLILKGKRSLPTSKGILAFGSYSVRRCAFTNSGGLNCHTLAWRFLGVLLVFVVIAIYSGNWVTLLLTGSR